jgi:folylpolyglutamate synthase/dihydropteroate synthase
MLMTDDGVKDRFHVSRFDGRDEPGGDRADSSYIVLDVTHNPYAPYAVAAYAQAIRATHPLVAADLDDVASAIQPADLKQFLTDWLASIP